MLMNVFNLRLVPDDFIVPTSIEQTTFRLRPLCLKDSLIDYSTIMDDYAQHYRTFQEQPDVSTKKSYHIYDNMVELAWHELSFKTRTCFAYVVEGKNPDYPSYRGTLYFFPSSKKDYDVVIYLWITNVEPNDNLEEEVFTFTQQWVADSWPFENPVYPGRLMSFADYELLADGRTYESQKTSN